MAISFLLSALFAPIAVSKELISKSNELLVTRDFGPLRFDDGNVKPRLFVEPVRNVDAQQSQRIHTEIEKSLRELVEVIFDKSNAQYRLQIVFEQKINRAIRNPEGAPALGFILFSICKSSILDIAKDCETLTYFYFAPRTAEQMFSAVLPSWLQTKTSIKQIGR